METDCAMVVFALTKKEIPRKYQKGIKADGLLVSDSHVSTCNSDLVSLNCLGKQDGKSNVQKRDLISKFHLQRRNRDLGKLSACVLQLVLLSKILLMSL